MLKFPYRRWISIFYDETSWHLINSDKTKCVQLLHFCVKSGESCPLSTQNKHGSDGENDSDQQKRVQLNPDLIGKNKTQWQSSSTSQLQR